MTWHLRLLSFLFFCPRRQLIPRSPECREEVVMDHLPEHLDWRSLRSHDLVADDARDDLVMADAPHRDPLVPLEQRFGQLVQLLVLAPAHVELDDVEPGSGDSLVERLAERRRDPTDVSEPGRVETAAVPEHAADRLVLPR